MDQNQAVQNNEPAVNTYTFNDEKDSSNKNGSIGPIIGVVVIVIVLILGSLYFIGKKVNDLEQNAQTPAEITASEDTARQSLETQGTSDEVSAIETDLNATSLDNLDAELGTVETELGL